MADALDNLIVNESESLDLVLLASLVQNYLKFTKEGEMFFERDFYKLKDWQKVLIYLLGRKVILIKKLKKEFIEEVSPKEIEDLLGIKSKSITKYASVELKGILKSNKGEYRIPNYSLFKCEDILKKK
jgi:hypothetical protein